MSGAFRLRRLWGTAYQLSDLLGQAPGGHELAARDLALLTIAGQLALQFPHHLVFKGGFVLRHVHGVFRFSKDVDATRHNPAQHKLDAREVADTIREASIGDMIRFHPREPPATNSARSLDFDRVKVTGSLLPDSEVQVEISYRESVLETPDVVRIGSPFYEEFEILAMAASEMAAEKLRALAQRTRATDLADLAELLSRDEVRDEDVARLASAKFELVKQGAANRIARVEQNLQEMGADYDDTVPFLFPAARSYREAMEIVWPRVKALIS